ncbi:MAG TPA: hypothetical protein VMT36_02790 [Candidatus Saccharimonadia bacterium]|nr:hypothetical protein [Candidatus Saccharimonadia bacterium]
MSQARPPSPEVEPRGEWEIRWRQARNVPPPIVRAITADVVVAVLAGLVLLAWDLSVGAGLGAFALYVLVVVGTGSVLTYIWAPLPSGASGIRRRSVWAAMLGMFAAFPVAYIVLVIVFQLIRPLL